MTRIERLRQALRDLKNGGHMAMVNIVDLLNLIDEFESQCKIDMEAMSKAFERAPEVELPKSKKPRAKGAA